MPHFIIKYFFGGIIELRKKSFDTHTLVKIAMMTAISLVLLLLVRIPYPMAPFLVYDPADVPIYITAFAMGPIPGLIVTFIVCFIQAFLLGGDGIYGFVMHFIATGLVAVVMGCIYNKHKTKKAAIIALSVSVLLVVVVMCIMNYFVTASFMGVDKSAVLAMIPTVIIPFNLIKAGLNSLLTFLLYKKISKLLHKY